VRGTPPEDNGEQEFLSDVKKKKEMMKAKANDDTGDQETDMFDSEEEDDEEGSTLRANELDNYNYGFDAGGSDVNDLDITDFD